MKNDSSALLHNALGSATAGIIGRLFTHPLDTAKARLQAVGTHYKGPMHAISQTFRVEGLSGLYRGFRTVLIGGTPGTMLYLCSYDMLKSSFHQSGGSSEFMVHFGCGMMAETIACIIYVPVDVIKERMQVQEQGKSGGRGNVSYRNGWDALQKIVRTEGVRGIYRGYGATLASFGPFSALYFCIYERFKSCAKDAIHMSQTDELSFPYILLTSCSAGALASWLTSPLDMAKFRLQVQRADGRKSSSLTYKGMIDCLETTFRQEGVRGLFRGAGARVLHFAPATTITMTCYETFRSFFAKHLPS